jgi:hypothetical protein
MQNLDGLKGKPKKWSRFEDRGMVGMIILKLIVNI